MAAFDAGQKVRVLAEHPSLTVEQSASVGDFRRAMEALT
jgi:hypothetical protein